MSITTLITLVVSVPLALYLLTGITLCILDEGISLKVQKSALKLVIVAAPIALLAIYLIAT